MNFKKPILSIILVVSASLSFGQKATQTKRLDSLFTSLAAQNQFSGSVLIAEKGKVIYKTGRGYSNEETKALNNPQTIFELASCSKQFIGVAIALLHRENKLNYTDDITVHIPELSSFKGVTVYDLLRHTSGIPEYLFGEFTNDWKNERIATNEDVIAYYAARKDSLEFAPHSAHQYTNTNYVFLATIIERVSGQKLNDYLTQKIFKPLKMNRTFIYNRRFEPKKIKNYATGYVWINNSFEKAPEDDKRVGRMVPYYLDGIVGNAKVNSTVEDLYKWMEALKNNQLLTRQEFDEVMEITKTADGEKVSYGFGFEVRKNGANISYGHTGSWDGYITFMYYSSVNDRTILVLNNFKNGVCAYETMNEILDDKPTSKEFIKKVPLTEEKIKSFVGEYTNPEDPSQKHIISYLDGHLVYNTDKLNWDMRFFPSSENTFQAIRQGGTDGAIKFTPQSDGTMKLEMTQYGQVIGNGIRN
ncbi:MAG: beta-lactamase family protein [Fluviicola sp.]|jgi:CubicO group peptidase (beta-lactamase class C family)|uniref:serine hydrolase domain-containing protein n=1 Tax=Fluviicola sp. TaxID=1917219 RepID=UPI00261DAC0D|nr:serine hydrolase domain-containing protein [Fluviicola sp.]MDF3026033.1 beta-lactamase family protein [Fluviicola sp.]